MQKNRNKACIALTIIFVIISGVLLFMAVTFPKKFFEDYIGLNTVEYRLTVKSVETDDKSCTVFVEEFDCGLLFDFKEIICEDYLKELKPGVKIDIRILEMMEESFFIPDVERIFLVAIKTDNKEIVTLESHRAIVEKKYKNMSVIGYIWFSVFIVLSVVCFVLSIRNPNNKHQIS